MRTLLQIEPMEERVLPAAFQQLPVLPFSDPAVLDHARAIVSRGEMLGRNADVFLKFGDSNSSTGGFIPPVYLTPLGMPGYNPITSGLAATHPELLGTRALYSGGAGSDSFLREGPGAFPGWTISNVLSAVQGQIAATNAGIALVMIGTNDMGTVGNLPLFKGQLQYLVGVFLTDGVLPVLSTIPDSHYANGAFHKLDLAYNQIIADVAAQYRIPLWNAWLALNQLPNQGIGPDGVHLNTSPNGGGSLWPADMAFGQNVRNLEALQILDWFQKNVAISAAEFLIPKRDWQPLSVDQPLYAVSRDAGSSSIVDVYDSSSGMLMDQFLALSPYDRSGVRVAMGDTNGDGFADIVCASMGPNGVVKVISGADGTVLTRFTPFKASWPNVKIAVGDLDGDGALEIVAARGNTGAVRIVEGRTFALAPSFPAFVQPTPGVTVAVANIDGLGPAIVVAGRPTSPIVRYFDATGMLLAKFAPFIGSGVGMAVAAADLDGDGSDEIIVGRDGAKQRLLVFTGATHEALAEFDLPPIADPLFGIRLGTMRSATGTDTLLVGSAPGAGLGTGLRRPLR